ncbi:MAG TPA: hypothetical protein VLN58_06715 [Verrucomicrobiae bacterium]|nr:hypothetical protein [Verrucomicrobiae bacterium]
MAQNTAGRSHGLSKEDEEQIREWSRQLFPRASEEQLETMLRSMRCLMEESKAGEERRAIMNLLMRHDAVPASALRRLCSQDVEARIAEMREAGIHIESQSERRVNGTTEAVYGAGTPEFVRAMRLVCGTPAGSNWVM